MTLLTRLEAFVAELRDDGMLVPPPVMLSSEEARHLLHHLKEGMDPDEAGRFRAKLETLEEELERAKTRVDLNQLGSDTLADAMEHANLLTAQLAEAHAAIAGKNAALAIISKLPIGAMIDAAISEASKL